MTLLDNTEFTKRLLFGLNLSVHLFIDEVCIGLMQLALHGPVEIECLFETDIIRDRLYRVRAKCRLRGDHRFDCLTFQADNFFLIMYPHRPGEPRLRGGMWEVRSGARFCLTEHEIIRWQYKGTGAERDTR